jgi:hypothetical protein
MRDAIFLFAFKLINFNNVAIFEKWMQVGMIKMA